MTISEARIVDIPVVPLEKGNYSSASLKHKLKDQYKSDFSNKYIGRGIGSTGEYARLTKEAGLPVNSGIYTPDDVVFISANGKRPGAYDPDLIEIKKAVDAGATFLTDGSKNRPEGGREYNTGEQMVADFLRASGYEEQPELNGEVSRWYKKGTTPAFVIKQEIHLARTKTKGYAWKRKSENGFEVSSAARHLQPGLGDIRFSALNAKLKDGRTIEEAYQLDVKGYRVDGNDWRLGKGKPPKVGIDFQEDQSFGYRDRTIGNATADATIAIAADFSTAGEKLTASAVKGQQKMYIPIQMTSKRLDGATIAEIVERLNKVNASTLNIAGNGAYTLKGKTQRQIDDYVHDVLKRVINHPSLLKKPALIRSGGQSGIDEAGVKAAQRLGIKAMVLAPKGWMYKDEKGNTIKGIESFQARFRKDSHQLYHEYKELWQQWAEENPKLMDELAVRAAGKDLTDQFANTEINQARALSEILNDRVGQKPVELQVPTETQTLFKSTDESKGAESGPPKVTLTSGAVEKLKELEDQLERNTIDSLDLLKASYAIKIEDISKQLGREIKAEDFKELFSASELVYHNWNTLTPEQEQKSVSLSSDAIRQLNETREHYEMGLITEEEQLNLSIHIKVQDIYAQKPVPVKFSENTHLFSPEEIDLIQKNTVQANSVQATPKIQLAKNDHAVLKVVDPPDPYLPKRYQQENTKYKVVPVEEINAYNRKSKVQKIPLFTGTKSEAHLWANGPEDIRELVEHRKEVRMEIQVPFRNTNIEKLQTELSKLNDQLGLGKGNPTALEKNVLSPHQQHEECMPMTGKTSVRSV